MQILKFFVGGVLFTFSILAVIAWLILPDEFKIEERIIIDASEAAVFETLNDLQTWERWIFESGSNDRPKIEYTSTKREGIGASMLWIYATDNQIKVEIREAFPPERLVVVFNSIGQGETTTISIFLESTQSGTEVRWLHKGDYGWGIASRLSASILDFEGETAAIYAAQLKRLKSFVENYTY